MIISGWWFIIIAMLYETRANTRTEYPRKVQRSTLPYNDRHNFMYEYSVKKEPCLLYTIYFE